MTSNEHRTNPRGEVLPASSAPGAGRSVVPGPESLRRSRFDLASTPNAVRWGRAHVSDVLGTWRVAEVVVHDAVLVASELLSNAIQHAQRPWADSDGRPVVSGCSLLLWLAGRGLTVSVYDTDRRPPVLRAARIDAERGRGLLLVQNLSEAWGYNYPSPDSGKLVWARLAMPAPVMEPKGQQSLGVSVGTAAVMSR